MVLAVEPLLFRVKEVESFEPLDPTELDITVSALSGFTETSASRLSDLSDAALGAISVDGTSLLFDLLLPLTWPSAVPARSGDESIGSGDSRKKNRDWWLNTGSPIFGNSGTVTCSDVVAAVGRVELAVPGGGWASRDADGLWAYCGGMTSCVGKTCNRGGTAVTAFGSTLEIMCSGVALTRPDVRLGGASRGPGVKCEGR